MRGYRVIGGEFLAFTDRSLFEVSNPCRPLPFRVNQLIGWSVRNCATRYWKHLKYFRYQMSWNTCYTLTVYIGAWIMSEALTDFRKLSDYIWKVFGQESSINDKSKTYIMYRTSILHRSYTKAYTATDWLTNWLTFIRTDLSVIHCTPLEPSAKSANNKLQKYIV